MTTNQIEINIGEHGNSKLPDPNKPVVILNDVPIESMTGIIIAAAADEPTHVTLSFYATVKGKIVVEDEALKFVTREDFECMKEEH